VTSEISSKFETGRHVPKPKKKLIVTWPGDNEISTHTADDLVVGDYRDVSLNEI